LLKDIIYGVYYCRLVCRIVVFLTAQVAAWSILSIEPPEGEGYWFIV